ncbi:MAG: HlyD family secretion protein, partial [Planctomycetales bacterium]|nr:HlyD family secretion protein [Planctomycetales bacterium]
TTQIAAGEIVALRKQLAAASREYESLQVRAPRAGKVVRRGLAQLLGTYVQEGEELLTIGREEAKELIVSLDQRDFDSVAPRTGQTVAVRVGSQGRFRGTLRRLEPRASTRLVHPALSAVAGGPLDVVATQRSPTATQSPELELTQPRFRAVVALPGEQAAVLHSGQRGQVLFGNRQGGLGTTVYQFFSDWLTQASR